jgi:putative zinc finger/helix-turn-helix YgiT family protein
MEEYKDRELCPLCNEGNLRKSNRDQSFNYKGKQLIIPNYTVYVCDNCNEELVDEKTINAAEKQLRDFHRKVDNLLTTDEIIAIRKKLGLTQEKLAEKLGISRITEARYESGQLTQDKSQDIHLRLLIENPNCLVSLQSKESLWKNQVVAKPTSYNPEKKHNYHLRIKSHFTVNNQTILIEDNYNNGTNNKEALAA